MENLLHVQVKTQLQQRSFIAIKFVNGQRLFIRVQIGLLQRFLFLNNQLTQINNNSIANMQTKEVKLNKTASTV